MITERNNSNFIAKVESLFVSAFDSLPNWRRRAAGGVCGGVVEVSAPAG